MRRLLVLIVMVLWVSSNQAAAAPGDYGTLLRDLQKPEDERSALTLDTFNLFTDEMTLNLPTSCQ